MAIFGTGTDIIEVQRVKKAIENSKSFKQKVFSQNEITYCDSISSPMQSYTARFAAKEAFLKAIGTGWADGIKWTEISVEKNEKGAPFLILSGKTLDIFHSLNCKKIHLSLSHIKDYAVAFVIIESD
jgi:holo-[acyl-carrier protein] synthase